MIIDFTPEGTVESLHNDSFDLGFLGAKTVTRATEIRFHEESQTWQIELPVMSVLEDLGGPTAPVCTGFQLPFPEARGFATYEQARRIEVRWLDACRLQGFDPWSINGQGTLIGILRAKRYEHASY